MRQIYKLRLGDGTVLVVDRAGLTNWLSDPMALVQPAGAELWTPLRSFLDQAPRADRRTARYRPQPPFTSRRDLPLVYPKPLEERVLPPLAEAAPEPATAPFAAPPLPPPAPPLPEPPASVLPNPPDEEYEVDLSPCLAGAASPTERVAPPASEEEAPGPDGGPGAPSPADEEDVGWMTLPGPAADEPPEVAAVSWLDTLAPDALGALPSRPRGGSRPTPGRARHALGARGPLLREGSHSPVRRAWRAARVWLASLASSSYTALLGLWKSIGPGEHAATTSLFGELARDRLVGSEAGAPPPQRSPSAAAGRLPPEKRRNPPPAYRPRKSPHDGLPLLQLESLDDVEASSDPSRGRGAERPTDELPASVLEPVDETRGAGSTRVHLDPGRAVRPVP